MTNKVSIFISSSNNQDTVGLVYSVIESTVYLLSINNMRIKDEM